MWKLRIKWCSRVWLWELPQAWLIFFCFHFSCLLESNKMSKRGWKKDDEDLAGDDIVICELSRNRRVSVRNWQGKVVVDIREFYVKDGKTMPGRKGISLSMDQWEILQQHVDVIDNEISKNIWYISLLVMLIKRFYVTFAIVSKIGSVKPSCIIENWDISSLTYVVSRYC